MTPPWPTAARKGSPRAESGARSRRAPYSTSTITPDGRVVPWLAADGPLAYSPEAPPERDYYFQYGWVLPGIFADHTNTRRHFYFGTSFKDDARELFAFWKTAREGAVERVACYHGTIGATGVTAPVAVYRAAADGHGPAYLLMQHGSYQLVPAEDQPLLGGGDVLLYRGVQKSMEFRLLRMGEMDAATHETWRRYVGVQVHVLSDSVRSFNSIHDRAVRCETQCIRDRSTMTDDIARARGLDIDGEGFTRALWTAAHQSFALARWVAERKFGPNYVVCRTPLDNIRMTTLFVGEHEVRIIDPDRVEILEEHGCRASRGAPVVEHDEAVRRGIGEQRRAGTMSTLVVRER